MTSLEVTKKIIMSDNSMAFLLLGKAGIGKSQLVKDTAMKKANELGKTFIELSFGEDSFESATDIKNILDDPEKYYVFIDVRLSAVEPIDLTGLPVPNDEGYFIYESPIWAYILSKCQGMLFLDEFTMVQRNEVYSAAYQLIWDRKSGFAKFRDDVTIVAAGNRDTDSSVARPIPAPLMNRFLKIEVDTPSVDDFVAYIDDKGNYDDAYGKSIICAYLLNNRSDFNRPPVETEVFDNFPTPRQWENLIKVIKKEDIDTIRETKMAGLIGDATAKKIEQFERLYRTTNIEEILKNPELVKDKLLQDKIIIMLLLAERINSLPNKNETIKKEIIKIEKVIENMTDDKGALLHECMFMFILMLRKKENNSKISRRQIAIMTLKNINKSYLLVITEVLRLINLDDN